MATIIGEKKVKPITPKVETQTHDEKSFMEIIQSEEFDFYINDYIEIKFPKAFAIATTVCDHLGANIGIQPGEREIGYLAMHIERVYNSGENN